MDFVNKLTGPAKLLGVVAIVCVGKLIYDHVQKKGNKLGYILSVALMGILYMYIANCVSKGDCTILSWVLAVVFAVQLLLLTGIAGMQLEKAVEMLRSQMKKVENL
jgi:hypothetical protein